MRGRWHNGADKWPHINQLVKEQKIGILALQETHLTKEDEDTINSTPGFRIQVISSIDPARTNAKGIAIVINKKLLGTSGIKTHVLAPGRAILTIIPWQKDSMIRVLAIYAPNDAQSNQAFWELLQSKLRNLPRPDLMLGDFNIIEDSLDRLPPKTDNASASKALHQLKAHLRLRDGWRYENPDTLAYTFAQSAFQGGSQSRIDRIYINDELLPFSKDWDISPPGIHTDHQLISARISSKNMPYVGKGRWSLPLHVLKDENLAESILNLGKTLQNKIDECEDKRSDIMNPQLAFSDFKTQAIKLCRTTAKKIIPKKRNKLLTQLKTTMNDQNMSDEDKRIVGSHIQEKLNQLEIKCHDNNRNNLATKIRLESESATSKLWAKSGKEQKPRDTIVELRNLGSDTNNPTYENRSDKMAELAKTYYDELQHKDLAPIDERDEACMSILDLINIRLSPNDKNELETELTNANIEEVLHLLPNGKAPGIDGIPYEFWKWVNDKAKSKAKASKDNDVPFNFSKCLTQVYNDIERNGVAPNSGFAEGLLNPLHKKKDRREIANYRPITLLNCDYKAFTKALALKLARTVPSIIHENQAGFIPGRSITDQIRLTQMIMEFAEVEEINGVIVALDQEKAYDKISHSYLWKVLEKFDVPDNFIKTVQSLYKGAETAVMINGEISPKFKITRGVRQGDPLSCLLFDIAIEPLAEMLRQSGLSGFKAKDMAYRIVVTMFADDTTVYLTEKDDFSTLSEILTRWCKASGAKFNTSKTEIIPIGTKEYREKILTTRKINNSQESLPENVDIAKDGKATRILGAWIGNGTDENSIWSPTLDKIESALQRWERWHPTIEGRRIIIQRTIGSMTQYLTSAQGMPKDVEDLLMKRTREFAWDSGGNNSVSLDILHSPTNEGGKNILNLRDRNEAIELKWLKSLLAPSPERAPWTFFAHALIAKAARSSPVAKPEAKINTFLQTWEPSYKKLPTHLKRILKTAKKFNVRWEAISIAPEIARQLPIWFHLGASNDIKKLNNTPSANCLRINHDVRYVQDLEVVIRRSDPNHRTHHECPCAHCTRDRARRCRNPIKCIKVANELLTCVQPKWNPATSSPNYNLNISPEQIPQDIGENKGNSLIIFDPIFPSPASIEEGFRVFVTQSPQCTITASQTPNPQGPAQDLIRVTIAESHRIDNDGDHVSGGVIWFGDNDPRNKLVKLPGELANPGAGEIGALLHAIDTLPLNAPIHVSTKTHKLGKDLSVHLSNLEDQNWSTHPNGVIMKVLTAKLRSRSALTTFSKCDHNTPKPISNKIRMLADESIQKEQHDTIPTEIENSLNLTGMKLTAGSQKNFYKNIRQTRRSKKQRRRTTMNLAMAIHAAREISGLTPSSEKVWASIRDRDTPKNIRGFLWKCLHDAYKIGEFWDKIPHYEHRGICGICNSLETMEHILIGCESVASRTIWQAAEDLWCKREDSWPEIRFGTILSCNLANLNHNNDKSTTGKNRLFKILVLESAHLIWKLRCERTIKFEGVKEKFHSENEIYNRWVHAINTRLKFDRLLTDSMRYGKKALKTETVLKTWSGVLLNEENLPDNWVHKSGVLVGMAPRRPPGRLR